MTGIDLQHSTGNADVDHSLRGIVGLFETAFPARVVSYYVEGSYADRTAVATSDLDLIIVFRDPFGSAGARAAAEQEASACKLMSGLELDLTLAEETQLRLQADPMFKFGARLLYGSEIRDTIPLMPIALWAHQRMHAAYWLMINVLDRPKPVRAPLDFPQPQARFYGYAARNMRLADGSEIPTTRNLVRVMGWIATARIAHQAQRYVVRKRDCPAVYQETINDEWVDLLEQIDRRCRTAWQYRIPSSPLEQAELQSILKRTPAFENHFLLLYRQFLLAELTGSDPNAQLDALRFMDQTLFADPAIIDAVQNLRARPLTEH